MEASFEHLGPVLLISVSGRLDTVSAPHFDEQIAPACARQPTRILLDMSALSYLSSAGVRSILQLVKFAADSGRRVGLFNVPAQIKEVIDISGLPSRLDLYPDRASALKHAAA
jgi:stage II sporulation protein AA (anti-sigma F factor antagonist)